MFPRPAAPIFCSVSKVSEATLDTFFGGILGLVHPSGPWSVSRVSEATLGTFLVGFSD